MKLAINLATRNRPELLYSTIMMTISNISRADTVLMISADADDQATIDMLGKMPALGSRLLISVKEREDTIAAKWNRVLEDIPDADLYMTACDDGPFITAGFDERIVQAATFHDGIGVVTNWLENLTFPGIQVVTRRLVELMGNKIYVEHFPYWFVDHWLLDITRMIGRDAFADVRLDCSSNRPTTMEMREPAFWATFYDALHLRRHQEAARIIAELDETQEHKDRLIGYFPRWDQHSKMINEGVRNNPGLAQVAARNPPDDRYRRIKAAAVEMLKNEILPELKAAA